MFQSSTQKLALAWTLVVASLALGSAQTAQAGVWIQTSGSIFQSNDDAVPGRDPQWRWASSSTLGYAFLEGFVLGGQLLTARNGDSSNRSLAWGPKGGFLHKGFELTFAYLPFADDYTSAFKRSGNGFAVNLGYTAEVWGALRLGAQATYWSMNFNKLDSATLAPRQHLTYVLPLMLAIGAEF